MKNKIILVLVFLFIFVLSCAEKHEAVKKFEDVVKTLQTGDVERASREKELKIEPETVEVYSEAYKKMTYKINRSSVQDNEVIINVTMKTPDFNGLVGEYVEKLSPLSVQMEGKSPEEKKAEEVKLMKELVKARLSSPDLKYLERTFDVTYKKSGDDWIIDQSSSKDYIEMITFGMLKVN